MGRTVNLVFAAVFVVVGIGGIVTGIARIITGETVRGLADLIVGGLVALHGVGNWREEV